jgi:hypothetical protein
MFSGEVFESDDIERSDQNLWLPSRAENYKFKNKMRFCMTFKLNAIRVISHIFRAILKAII